LPNGNVVVGSGDGSVYFLDPGGILKSTFSNGSRFFGTPVVLNDNNVVVGSLDSHLNFLDPNGRLLTTFATGGEFPGNPAVLKNGIIVTGSNDNVLHFLRPDGSEVQSLGPLGPLEGGHSALTAPSVMNDGTVVVGSVIDHTIYFIKTDPDVKPCSQK